LSHAVGWLNKHPTGPFFLWVHFYDPHDPYTPPEPYRTRYKAEPYDGEIAYTDSIVGKLLRELRTRGLFEGCLIAIMADHGEAFGEHGEQHHGIFLYDETIHIPMFFKLPPAEHRDQSGDQGRVGGRRAVDPAGGASSRSGCDAGSNSLAFQNAGVAVWPTE